MSKVKATAVQICIFTWKNYADVSDATGDDLAAFNAFAGVIVEMRKRHGANVPVTLDFCPLTDPQNQLVISQQGVDPNTLPAAQVWAWYEDGKTMQYFLSKGALSPAWTSESVKPYVTALLYRSKPSQQSLICKILPIVCDLPVWLWLAVAGFTTFEAAAGGKGVRQIAYAAGAGLAWQEFFKRGGFNALKK